MHSNFGDLQPDVQALGSVSDFVNEFIEAIGPQHIFDTFSRAEATLLSEYLECFGVPRQTVVVKEGDECDFLAILITGKAEVFKMQDGFPTTIQDISPGEIIGVMSFIDRQTRFASCITIEPSDFAVLTRDGLNAMLADHPRLGNKFLLVLLGLTASRLRRATEALLPNLKDLKVL
jgi:CRP/FNR family cyclic AMP-dependent transcriptional regulator